MPMIPAQDPPPINDPVPITPQPPPVRPISPLAGEWVYLPAKRQAPSQPQPPQPPLPPQDIILTECSSCPALCCRSLNIELSLASDHDRSLVKSLPDSTRLANGHLLLRRRDDGSCILLHNHRCTVWNHRPLACRTYSCLSRPEAAMLCFDALRHGINPKHTPPFFAALRLPQPPPNPEPPAVPH